MIQHWMDTVFHNYVTRNNLDPNTLNKEAHLCKLYLKHLLKKNPNRKIYRLGFEPILQASRAWLKDKDKQTDNLSGVTILKEYDTYFWCRLDGIEAFRYEGNSMSHCICTEHHRRKEAGEITVFSLRTNHSPKVTALLEHNTNTMGLLCKGNSIVHPKYYPYLSFITEGHKVYPSDNGLAFLRSV